MDQKHLLYNHMILTMMDTTFVFLKSGQFFLKVKPKTAIFTFAKNELFLTNSAIVLSATNSPIESFIFLPAKIISGWYPNSKDLCIK